MFLTTDELTELTGYKRPTSMIRWLRENQFVFTVAADVAFYLSMCEPA